MNLTIAQREFYEENGFIVFPKLIPDEVIDACRDRFVQVCDGTVEAAIITVMKDVALKKRGDVGGQYLINKIQDFLQDDFFFESYARHTKIVSVVMDIVGPNVTAVHSMLINKPPDSTVESSMHPMHQDMHYFPFRPANKIVASWTAMELINVENGCLYAVPGSHKKGKLYPHTNPDNDNSNMLYHGVRGFDGAPKINFVMEKGDTVFFHPLLLHGSWPNKTKGFRKAISVHYCDSNCEFVDVIGTSQENIQVETNKLALKRTGMDLKFSDIFKLKSRLVCGEPGNFQKFSSNL